ncbi:MAG: pyridoxamine 5'-phosphate oxidase [Bacteroidetes bacterium]|nr:pyridoxamine 5'-phosphate oxidase [Bacteroidota bacterium]
MSEIKSVALPHLDENILDSDPIKQFRIWLDDALRAKLPHGEAMALATSTIDGNPSARVVLLKHVDERGFVFYTNYESRKGKELVSNPKAALVFFWSELDRQIRVEGIVTRMPQNRAHQSKTAKCSTAALMTSSDNSMAESFRDQRTGADIE